MIHARLVKPLLWLGVSLVLILGIWLSPVGASDALLTSRLNQLESNFRILRTQVAQLQSRIARLDNGPIASSPPIESVSPVGEPTLDAQFDNLAILVIELRDRIIDLESKVSALEAS